MNKKLSPFWTLFILTGLNLFNYMDRYVLSAVLPSMQETLKINDGDAGRLVTAFMLGYFLSSPIFGYLGDRSSRKWLIAIGIFIWSLGTVLTGFATALGMMLGFRGLVGVGEASYATISPGWISDTYGPAKRNNALTIFYVAIPVGAALGNIFGGQMAHYWSWQSAFIIAGAPGLLLAMLLLPFQEPKRGESEGKSGSAEFSHKPKWNEVFKLFLIRDYMLTVAGYVAYTFALGAFGVWGPSFLHRIHNIPPRIRCHLFWRCAGRLWLGGNHVGWFCRYCLAKATSCRICLDPGALHPGCHTLLVHRLFNLEHNLVHVLPGGGHVPALSFHRPSEYADHRDRACVPALQRHGAIHFPHPPVWRLMVSRNCGPIVGSLA